MRAMLIGKDPRFFLASAPAQEDTIERHVAYLHLLRTRFGATSAIDVISYAPRGMHALAREIVPGLTAMPTNSRHRLTFGLDAFRLAYRRARAHRPDVITAQTPYEEGLVGLLVAWRLGIPFLAQLHGELFSVDWHREHWLNGLKTRVACWVLRRARHVRVVSEADRAELQARLSIPAERISVCPVGTSFRAVPPVSRDAAKRAIDPALGGRPVVLFVGRFVAQKDLALWLRVAARVMRTDHGVRFMLVGDGPLLATAKALAAGSGLADRATFTGPVNYADLPRYFAAADVLFVSSRYEPFGRVILEAFLSGVPVVSTDCKGPRDLISGGEDGYIAAADDEAGLSDAILRLVRDPAERERMGAAGRAKAETRFGLPALAGRWIECWRTAAGRA